MPAFPYHPNRLDASDVRLPVVRHAVNWTLSRVSFAPAKLVERAEMLAA